MWMYALSLPVFVSEFPFHNIGENFHVTVRVGAEP